MPRPPSLAGGPPGSTAPLRPLAGPPSFGGGPAGQLGPRGHLPHGQSPALRPPMGQPAPSYPGQKGPSMQPMGQTGSQYPHRPAGFQSAPRGPPGPAPLANGHTEVRPPPFGTAQGPPGVPSFGAAGPPMRPGLRPPPQRPATPTSPPPTSIGARPTTLLVLCSLPALFRFPGQENYEICTCQMSGMHVITGVAGTPRSDRPGGQQMQAGPPSFQSMGRPPPPGGCSESAVFCDSCSSMLQQAGLLSSRCCLWDVLSSQRQTLCYLQAPG